MTAFVPITPEAALEITGAAGTPQVLADFAEAGLVKGYARLIETVGSEGRKEVRDQRISRDLWRRIIADGKVAEIWPGGTVRLVGDELKGGTPAVSIIGIRFDEKSIRTLTKEHGGGAMSPKPTASRSTGKRTPPAASVSPTAPNAADACVPPDEAPLPSHADVRVPRGMAPGAIALSIDETGAALGLGRTTIHKLINQGKLVATKVGGRTLIQADSIRALLTPAE